MREIRSDYGTNFVGVKRELREAVSEMDHEKITEKLCHQQIDWKFNPPAASLMGGVWERQIQTARRILDTLLREHGSRLDEDSLQTLLCEVESIINSRPFSIIWSDAKDPVPLSPNQILTIKTSIVLPTPGNSSAMMFTSADIGVEFSKEYLPILQKRPKWNKERRSMKIDEVVLLKDENLPRNVWPMG